jgi:hypothetical protein
MRMASKSSIATTARLSLAFAAVIGALLGGCSKKSGGGSAQADADQKSGKDVAMAETALKAVQKDLAAKEYEKATASMMQMADMVPMLSEQDAVKYRNQMRNLQMSLGEAAANGDAKAESAIMMLRMTSRENQMPRRR